jgi:prephenate dehydrogenase
MAEISVAILGLGRLGGSVGLALARYNAEPDAKNHFDITGFDSHPSIRTEAKKLGAIPTTIASLITAVEDKDVIVMALPYAETRRTFREMAARLRDGAVVLDLSPLKQPSMAWAAEYFPPEVYLVGATAVINPALLWDGLDDIHHARADLFDDGDFLLAPSPSAAPDAVELVTQLTELIGAGAHFIDPAEHDGLVAATEGIPAVLGAVAFRAMIARKGWTEARRLTNPNFGRLTHHLLDTHPDDLRDQLLNNRENIVSQLDTLLPLLTEFRDLLAENDRDSIEATLVNSADRYQRWLGNRTNGKWDVDQSNDNVDIGNTLLSGMLGGFLADKLQGKDTRDDT